MTIVGREETGRPLVPRSGSGRGAVGTERREGDAEGDWGGIIAEHLVPRKHCTVQIYLFIGPDSPSHCTLTKWEQLHEGQWAHADMSQRRFRPTHFKFTHIFCCWFVVKPELPNAPAASHYNTTSVLLLNTPGTRCGAQEMPGTA